MSSRSYLQWDLVNAFLTKKKQQPSDEMVTVYSMQGVMKHTIPNPKNASAVEGTQRTMDSGYFTQKDIYWCPASVFEDDKYWLP